MLIEPVTLAFVLYLLLGPGLWVALIVGLYAGRRRLAHLQAQAAPQVGTRASVSILIPAKDEASRIAPCVNSALNQDHGDTQVIVIDDRSTDGTGPILDQLAQANPGLRVLHIPPGQLPLGWTGKNHALHTGLQHATGDWLVFMDSDIVLQPQAVSQALSYALHKRFDFISLLGRLDNHGFWEKLLMPVAAATVSTVYLIPLTNEDRRRDIAFASGAFMLVQRSAYDAVGGHQAVSGRICEDVELARLLKHNGYRIRIFSGEELLSFRMYDSLGQIFTGWSRIFYGMSRRRPWRILLALSGLTLTGGSMLAAAFAGVWYSAQGDLPGGAAWLIALAFHVATVLFMLDRIYAFSHNPRRMAWLFPLSGVMLSAILLKALWACLVGRVRWRGTHYQAGQS